MKTITMMILLLPWLPAPGQAFPVITQGDLLPGDERLGEEIKRSAAGELTLASFNVRNLGAAKRSFSDYMLLADLVNEADMVILQEVGLGIFSEDTLNENLLPQYRAILSQLQIALGEEWDLCVPSAPSGMDRGREANIVVFRKNCNGFSCQVSWNSYVDLGPGRDMPVFDVSLNKNAASFSFHLGSVHLKPDDPERGEEMLKLAAWLDQNVNKVLVAGDFNWGYRRTPNMENYRGEAALTALHTSGRIFQVFKELSYLGKGNDDQLRTNMGFRSSAYFYDQIFISPDLVANLAHGGRFMDDCGIYAFDLSHAMVRSMRNEIIRERSQGLNKYIELARRDDEEIDETLLSKTLTHTMYNSCDTSTYAISDHRIVWIQLKITL